MNHRAKLVLSAVCLMLCIASVPGEAGDSSTSRGKVGVRFFQEFIGSADNLKVTVHRATESSCLQRASRSFLRSGQVRLVLEAVTTPGTGEQRWRLTDDNSGWWVELREESELRVEMSTPHGYGFPLFNRRYFGENHSATRTLLVSGVEVVSVESSLQDWNFAEKLTDELLILGPRAEWYGSMPTTAENGLALLKSLFDSGICQGTSIGDFGQLLNVLIPVISTWGDPKLAETYAGVDWRLEQRGGWRGVRADEERELQFLRGFQSVEDTSSPLASLLAPAGGGCQRAGE